MTEPAVTCVGVAAWDVIARVDRMPGPDERVEAIEIVEACGGPAATAAVTLARLGVPTALVSVVGNDPSGRSVLERLDGEGVDISRVRRDDSANTAQSLVIVSGASRAIVTRTIAPAVARELPDPPDTGWWHVDQLGWAAVNRRPRQQARLSVDDGNPFSELRLKDVALYAPTATRLSSRYPGRDLDAAVRAAVAEGAAAVVATLGADGAIAFDGHDMFRVPATPVDVNSTLGAGDVFHGALLAGLCFGLGLRAAAGLASVVAAASCTALDGQSGIPRRHQVSADQLGPDPLSPIPFDRLRPHQRHEENPR